MTLIDNGRICSGLFEMKCKLQKKNCEVFRFNIVINCWLFYLRYFCFRFQRQKVSLNIKEALLFTVFFLCTNVYISVYKSMLMNHSFAYVGRSLLTGITYECNVTHSYLSLGRSEIKTNRDSSRVPCV